MSGSVWHSRPGLCLLTSIRITAEGGCATLQSGVMTITVNGHVREVSPGTTVRQLIEDHKLTPEKVAVELNRRLIRSEKYDTVLSANDEIEIVTFVGGG